MKNPNRNHYPVFYNTELQKAVQKAAPVLDSYKAYLDGMSEDIKRLEEFIRSEGVNVEFQFPTGETPEDEAGQFDSFLEWKRDKSLKNFRIMYSFIREGEEDVLSDKARRPLLEWPVDIRIRGYQFLPRFMEELSNHIKTIQEKTPRKQNLVPLKAKEFSGSAGSGQSQAQTPKLKIIGSSPP